MRTCSQAERLVYLNHQVENGEDPGDASSYAAEIDSISDHSLADDYYDRNIRAIMQNITDNAIVEKMHLTAQITASLNAPFHLTADGTRENSISHISLPDGFF